MAIEVGSILPSQAIQEIHTPHSQLVQLVLAGYTLTDEARKNPIEAASFDFNFPDDRAAVFVAKQEGDIVGSVTFILWKDTAVDKRGGKFWPKLREINPALAQRASEINSLACDVGGVVVLPQLRGQHIGQSLLEKAVKTIHPSIIVGNTKTVEAVALRRKLVDLGYRIFFGDTEVTPGHEQIQTQDHQSIVQAYLYAKEYEDLLSEGSVFVYHGGLAPTIPDVEEFSPIIQEAFKPLIAAQRRLGDQATVMGPLLAIRREILEPR